MIRASLAHRITTHRPFFDVVEFNDKSQDLAKKAKNKKTDYNGSLEDALRLVDTPGLKTIALSVVKLFEKKQLVLTDPLPEGAKSYLQELYLEKNHNFHDLSVSDYDIGLRKGNYAEEAAIDFLSVHLNQSLNKNVNRVETPLISGTADIINGKIVRDIKCPITWKTFRKKTDIETAYYWQLIAYCYLYNCDQAFLDYILMPMPEGLIDDAIKSLSSSETQKFLETNEAIKNMPAEMRIKTYQLEGNIPKDIAFLESRLEKSKLYYDSLTYEKCMNLIT